MNKRDRQHFIIFWRPFLVKKTQLLQISGCIWEPINGWGLIMGQKILFFVYSNMDSPEVV